MTNTAKITAGVLLGTFIIWGSYETRNIDGDTGRPRHSTPSFPSPTPSSPALTIFEDGSAIDSDGREWPEDTFTWDCHTMGNKICGPGHG